MTPAESKEINIGIDVSKASLDVAVHETSETWSADNNAGGCAALVARLIKLKPTRIVIEATGGFQNPVGPAAFPPALPGVPGQSPHGRGFSQTTRPVAEN